MKKIVSALLVLCMLASSCLFLVSCNDELDEKKVGKDPLGTLATAFDNSLSAFFTDDAGAQKVLDKAAKKGSYEITLASDKWMGGDLTKIREVIYTDAKNDTFVSDTYVTYDGTKYNATVWADKTGIALKSESLFGNDDTLRLVFDSFIKEFDKSDLLSYMKDENDMSTEEVAELADELVVLVTNLRGVLDEKNAVMSEKEIQTLTDEICRILDQSISTTEKLDMNSEKKKHIVIEYTLNNDNLADLCKLLLNTAETHELYTDSSEYEEIKSQINAALDELDQSVELEAEIAFYINAAAYTITYAELDVRVDVLQGLGFNGEIDLNAELVFEKDRIVLSGELGYGSTDYGVELIVAKEKSSDITTYDMDAILTSGNIKLTLLDAEYTYNKKTYEMECTGKVSISAMESASFSMAAEYRATKSEVSFELKSLEVSSKSEELFKLGRGDEVSIVISVVDEIPVMDDRAEDIMDMSTRDWSKLSENVKNSQIGKLIFGMSDEGVVLPDETGTN